MFGAAGGRGVQQQSQSHQGNQGRQHSGVVASGSAAILLNEYPIEQAQIDGLWTYVGRKEQKTSEVARMKRAKIGAAP